MTIRGCELPDDALLHRYRAGGGHADCYATTIARAVRHEDFVAAFYTTWLFRLERAILGTFAARPSTDAQARELAAGTAETFAAWRVEARAADQLLLCDVLGRTRSWLMTAADAGGGTRLYFGSAVVPIVDRRTVRKRMGFAFRALLGFHHLYSRALLHAAARALERSPSRQRRCSRDSQD